MIEPSTLHTEALHLNRPESIVVKAALVSHDKDKLPFEGTLDESQNLMAKLFPSDNPLNHVGRSLSSTLDVYNITTCIDVWSLDIEGFKLQALKGLDFERHRPRYILIEIWPPTKYAVFYECSQKSMHLFLALTV